MSQPPKRAAVSVNGSKVLRRLKELIGYKPKTVFAGLRSKAKYADGQFMATILNILEFGTKDGKIPPRPILRTTFAKNYMRWKKIFINEMKSHKTPDEALTIAGEYMSSDLRNAFMSGKQLFEPNKSSTIKQKGFNAPLIDTGLMSKAIDYEIMKPKKKGKK